MRDYYVPTTIKGLRDHLTKLTGASYSSFKSKAQLYAIYFSVMDEKTDHVQEFYKNNSLV